MRRDKACHCGIRLLSLSVLCLFQPLAVRAELPPPIHSVEVSTPRDYGIVMGETLSAKVRAATDQNCQLETASLPQAGSAVADFLELRAIHAHSQHPGKEAIHFVGLQYQVFKGVRDAEIISVPAWALSFNCKGERVEAEVPAWNFTLTPIIPDKIPDEAVVIRGDMPPPVDSGNSHARWLAVSLSSLAGLGVYALWRLGLLPFQRKRPPFLRAASGLKRLGKQAPSIEAYRQGVRLVHEALNETAGHTLFSGQLGFFLLDHPHYAPLKVELERFFVLSDGLFFAAAPQFPTDYPLSELEMLCRKLDSAGK